MKFLIVTSYSPLDTQKDLETSSPLKKEAVIFVPSNFDSSLSDSFTDVRVLCIFHGGHIITS